jgi:Cupin-like domain
MSESCRDSYSDIVPHLISNTPAMLKTDSKGWASLRKQLSSLRDNLEFCTDTVCDVEVCLDPRDTANMNEGYSKERISMTFEEFFSHTIDKCTDNMYLKDWHIDKAKGLQFEYSVPEAFRDDWLNWYWKSCRAGDDDYSFLYMGGKGTFTALHHDVCCSNSWSLNLFGRKKWTLWAPSESHKLALHYTGRDTLSSTGSSSSDIIEHENMSEHSTSPKISSNMDMKSSSDSSAVHNNADLVKDAREGCYDGGQYPGVALAQQTVFYQGVDDVVFVPSGWYHQVENVPDETATESEESAVNGRSGLENSTVSLNRNWFNGFSVREVWLFLTREFTAVRAELQHMKPIMPAWTLEGVSISCRDGDSVSVSVSERAGRNKFGSFYSDYTPPMEFTEWHKEVDNIIHANAALNMKEFVELVSARVIMMETCNRFIDEEDSLPSSSHSDSNLDAVHTQPCAQTSRARDDLLQWSALLCPRYEQCISDEDVEVYRLLCTSLLPFNYDVTQNRLSSYLPANDIGNTANMAFSGGHDYQFNGCMRGEEGSASLQSCALEHTCSQLNKIVNDMLSSDDFLIHLTCCLQSEIEVLHGKSSPFDVALAVLVTKSSLERLQISICRLWCG